MDHFYHYIIIIQSLIGSINYQTLFYVMGVSFIISICVTITLRRRYIKNAMIEPSTKLLSRLAYEQTLKLFDKENISNHYSYLQFQIDDFNKLLSLYGFRVGDLIINEVSKRTQEVFVNANIYTFYANQFIIIIKNIDQAQILSLVKRLYEVIEENIYVKKQKITVTITTAIFIPDKTQINTKIVEQALASTLQELQEKGKNRSSIYTPNSLENVQRNNRIEKILHDALNNPNQKELFVVFQKKNDLFDNDSISGFEALIRLYNDELGYVSPLEFVKIAEESSLILQLGQFVLKKSCEFYLHMIKEKVDPVPISVNTSVIELLNSDFISQFKKTVDFYNVPPKYIEIELTESIFAKSHEHINEIIKTLKHYGVSSSIDDFGTGYSALSYLKFSEFDYLKIDRSFVKDIHKYKENYKLVKAIIQIADSLGFTIIAEGVETQDELECLRSLGCHYVQGFYFGKPVRMVEALEQLYEEQKQLHQF